MRNVECGMWKETRFACGSSAARIFIALIVVGGLLEIGTAYAQEVVHEEGDASKQATEAKEVRSTIDLGMFQVKDLRPSQNETAKIFFSVHLAMHQGVSQSTVKQLERWQHRLRDQVIIAIRLSEAQDFLEPDLAKFRRSISLRVNRVLKALLVSEAMLTEFTFTTN
jgi:hypothetical protein